MGNFFIIGLDLGQSQDYTALAIMEQVPTTQKVSVDHGTFSQIEEKPGPKQLHVRHLERFRLGTTYPDIVERVKALINSDEIHGDYALIVDQTGVGRPVVDMMRLAGLGAIAVTITGGTALTKVDWQNYLVPKRELVSSLQLVLQTKRLQFAKDLPELQTLLHELNNFQVTVTEAANDIYGGRTGVHDDMVLSVCLAAWYAEYASAYAWLMA